ncbi:PR domain zinc finger protein 16-like [Sinocyclocheilus anshuiensis]|uniref:PR domain zinc finger protein 16-like n=1 Tax=Sinocyclocheilus anshuiensis TaxID=1608454 RepID=UPI0007BAB7D8|nr:PREDICTED: PR domain zinc finger protein 16-like [Sinocyclocheilus anshuiensis]
MSFAAIICKMIRQEMIDDYEIDGIFPAAAYESEAVDSMYDTEPNLVTGESAEEETEDSVMSPIAVGPSSPQLCNEDFTPKEGSPYEVPVYIPDDIPIPADLELRESSVPGSGLGIWAKVKIHMGERFGPYNGLQSITVKETTYGWEQMLNDHETSSQDSCIKKQMLNDHETSSQDSCIKKVQLFFNRKSFSDTSMPYSSK